MNLAGKQKRRTLKKKQRRSDEHARKNVVSLRISDQEKKILQKITENSSKNISEVVREALEFWLEKRPALCMEF